MKIKLRPFGALAVALLTAFAPLAVPNNAHATPTITEYYITTGYSSTNQPGDIVSGSDGALWYTQGGAYEIGRITTSGSFSAYTPSSGNYLTKDANGDMWTASCNTNKVEKISTSGTLTASYTIPNGYICPRNITGDANGNLWVADQDSTDGSWTFITKVTSTGSFTTYNISDYGYNVNGFAAGPDGNVWFTMSKSGSTPKIAKITPSGTITKYTSPCNAAKIAAGSDGALWFTCGGSINRITTSGTVTTYSLASGSFPAYITQGPDGAMWFTQNNTGGSYGASIGRISMSGSVTVYPLTSQVAPQPRGIITGPDGALWFTESYANRIGRITIPEPTTPLNLTLGASVTNGNASLSWSAADGASTYDIYRDNAKVGSASQTSYMDTGLSEGNHDYYVKAVNSSGTSAASNTVTVTIDKTSPTVQVTAPADNSIVSGTTTFTGSVTDTHFGYYLYYVNNGTDTATPSITSWTPRNSESIATLDTTTLANGNYHITFVARDNVGNYSIVERQVTIQN